MVPRIVRIVLYWSIWASATRVSAWLQQPPAAFAQTRKTTTTTTTTTTTRTFEPVSRRFSTASPEGEVAVTAGVVYDAKKIRNFSIIAHIGTSCWTIIKESDIGTLPSIAIVRSCSSHV